MPTIRPVLCPMGLHQSDETNSNFPPQHGGAHDSLHRRYTPVGGLPEPSGDPPTSLGVSVNKSGIYYQLFQVDNYTYPEDRVSGVTGGLNVTTLEFTRGKTPPDQDGGEPNQTEITHYSPTAGTADREAECNCPGSAACSLVLSLPTRRPTTCIEQQQSGLQYSTVPITSVPRRTVVVARETGTLERQTSLAPAEIHDHRIRCVSPGLGSSVQWHQDGRSLEPTGTADAHKLLGVAGSNIGSKILCEGSKRDFRTTTAGQSDCSSLHQQLGRHSIASVDGSSQSLVAVGSIQGSSFVCGVHPGCNELCCRRRVQNSEGSNRLEATPPNIQSDQPEVGSSGSGPVCNSPVNPAPTVLQLEAGPASRSNRCLQPAVGSSEGLCEPTMVPDCQGSLTSEEPTGPVNPRSSSMERSTLVPSSAGNAIRLSPTTSSLTEPVPVAPVGQGSDGSSTPTGRMAYLRQKFGRSNLSESAKELLLASWRSKTSQAYDSHFRKWLGWCTERGCDPISGPISDVANFLANLHSQGYQTSSLNAYRSAISSVHDRVDDVDVGKHPLISRLLKGAFHARPPLPRYSRTWDVQVVLNCMEQWGDTTSLPLKLVTFKLVMLMCLVRPSRSAELASLHVDRCHFKPEGVTFLPSGLAKQARQSKPLTNFFFASFPDNKQLCPVQTLRHYLRMTEKLRKATSNSHLFVAIVKPHNPVAPCTIARWLKEVLRMSGIDISIFTAHSTRGASSSAAADSGITISDILKAADWSTESVFRKFYYRPTHNPLYGRAVLSSTGSET